MICRTGEQRITEQPNPISFRFSSSHLTLFPLKTSLWQFTLNHPISSACFDTISLFLLSLFSPHYYLFWNIYSFISQIVISVLLLLPYSILPWSTICKFCPINGWHDKKNPSKTPLILHYKRYFIPIFFSLLDSHRLCLWISAIKRKSSHNIVMFLMPLLFLKSSGY